MIKKWFLFAFLFSNLLAAPFTNSTTILNERVISKPNLGVSVKDSTFGLSIKRIADSTMTGSNQGNVHNYSQLQAFNSSQSLLLLKSNHIISLKTNQTIHKVDFGWPTWGNGLRWSPNDSNALFATGGITNGYSDSLSTRCGQGQARFLKYKMNFSNGAVTSKQVELIGCFPEYVDFNREASMEDLSDDGRYVALVGRRADNIYEFFSYDIVSKIKSPVYVCPSGRVPDWVSVTPSGKYVMAMWGRGDGISRNQAGEAFDRATMGYLGKVTTSTGHGDIIKDSSNIEWYVYTNANNAHFLNANHYIVKSRIPNGVAFNTNGSVNTSNTVSQGLSVALVQLDWYHGIHVSCRGTLSTYKGCVVTTMEGNSNGIQPFEKEMFYVDLTSTATSPKVERLAHHRSNVEYLKTIPDAQCPMTSYWAQPHASLSPDGRYVVFGSAWNSTKCEADAYLLDLNEVRGLSPIDTSIPPVVTPTPPVTPIPPIVTPINSRLDTLKLNQWYSSPTFRKDNIPLQIRPWNSMAYTHSGKTFLYSGYGPSDRGNYCIYANAGFMFNPVNDTLALENLVNWRCYESNGYKIEVMPENSTTPTPSPRHVYGQMTYSPFDTSIYIAHGASSPIGHPHDFWRYSFNQKRWILIGAAPGGTATWDCVCETHLIYADSEIWFIKSPTQIHVYSLTVKTWRSISIGSVPSGMFLGSHGAYDPIRKTFFFYGSTESIGANNQFNLFKKDSLKWVAKTGPITSRFAGVAYNSRWDRYILGKGQGRSDLWSYNPKNDTWAEIRSTTSLGVQSSDYVEFSYDPVNDVIVNLEGEKFWYIRYQPSDILPGTKSVINVLKTINVRSSK